MARRLRNARPASLGFGEAFARTGAERMRIREHRTAAKTTRFAIPDGGTPKPKIAGRGGGLRYRGWRLLCLLALSGCERIVAEPPPPPSRHEIAIAPPGARGARAAGTEAAPKPPTLGVPDPNSGPSLEAEPEGEVPPESTSPPPGMGVPL